MLCCLCTRNNSPEDILASMSIRIEREIISKNVARKITRLPTKSQSHVALTEQQQEILEEYLKRNDYCLFLCIRFICLNFFALLKSFEAAEQDVREGLALEVENKYLITNLAPALLFQGKVKDARGIYQTYQAKAFDP